jgi:hypothetical protein
MAFILNHFQSQNGLSTLTLHEPQGAHNCVVYVVVPNAAPARGRQTAAQLKTSAKKAAKKALIDAAASL